MTAPTAMPAQSIDPPAPRRRSPTAWFAAAVLPCVAGCPSSESPNDTHAPWFAEESVARGIDFAHRSGFAGRHLLPEIMGGGAALADVDGDGDLDVYIVQSGSLHDADGAAAAANRLYINHGGRFAAAANGHGAADAGYGMGAAAGDYDNDGDVDLYVTNFGPNALLRNDGAGRFEDVARTAGVADPGWGTAAAFVDFDADGHLDLFVVNYINWSLAMERDCYIAGILTYCPPENYNAPAMDRLFRNNGDGTFAEQSAAAGLARSFGNGLGAVSGDFDHDGRLDLFVANDMMVNQLWLNRGGMRFADEAAFRGCAVDEHGVAKSGMGVAAGDVDDDGDDDILVVNLQGQSDSFYRNAGDWFEDATEEVGLGAASRRYTRFGVVLADFDNDGRLDLYEANGRVDPGEANPNDDDPFAEPNIVYRGTEQGRFQEVRFLDGAVQPLAHTSRGLAVGDVDDDGGLDLLVVNRDAPPYLLMNRVPNRGAWVRFRVRTEAGRDAHGAKVSVVVGSRRIYRRVQPEGSYLSSSDPRVHFGLGRETSARRVTVRWPTGEVEAFGDFEAGRVADLRQGQGMPGVWDAAAESEPAP